MPNEPHETASLSVVLLLALAIVAAPVSHAEEGDRLPYHVTVDVAYGKPLGPTRLREQLARGLLRELDNERCFETISSLNEHEETDADIRLTVLLDKWRDETEHEMSLAVKNSDEPDPDRNKLTVENVEVYVYMELVKLPDGKPFRQKQYHQSNSYRPLFQEDAKLAVEDELLDDIIRIVRNFACKGTDKKLDKQIEQAR